MVALLLAVAVVLLLYSGGKDGYLLSKESPSGYVRRMLILVLFPIVAYVAAILTIDEDDLLVVRFFLGRIVMFLIIPYVIGLWLGRVFYKRRH